MATLSGVLVYQNFVTPDGVPIKDLVCRASILNTPYNDLTVIYVNDHHAVQSTTNINGLVEWILPLGSTVHVTARQAGVSYTKVVSHSGLAPTAMLLTDLVDK